MPQHSVLPMHGKQHCPGGPDPIPCWPLGATWRGFREGPSAGDMPCPSGDDIVLLFNTWENTDDTIFEEVFDAVETTSVSSVRLLASGIYSVYAGYDWETMVDNQLYWITVQTGWINQPTQYSERYGWPSPGGSPFISFVRTFPPYPETASGGQVAEIDVYAGQNSGITRDVDGATPILEIVYLGPLPTTA